MSDQEPESLPDNSDESGKFKANFTTHYLANFSGALRERLLRLQDHWLDFVAFLRERLLPLIRQIVLNLSQWRERLRQGAQHGHSESDQPSDYSEYQDSDGPTELSLRRTTQPDQTLRAPSQAVPPPPPSVPRPFAEPRRGLSPLADPQASSYETRGSYEEAPEPFAEPIKNAVGENEVTENDLNNELQIVSEPTAFIERAELNITPPERDNSATAILRLPQEHLSEAGARDPLENHLELGFSNDQSESQFASGEGSAESAAGDGSRTAQIASLHASIWIYDGAIAAIQPKLLTQVLHEVHSDGSSVAGMFQGYYERNSALSFSIHWELNGQATATAANFNHADEAQLALTLRAALMIRQNFMQWNLTRSRNGLVPLTLVMGADIADGFVCEANGLNFVGEAPLRARALSQLSMSLGTDLLVSETLWSALKNHFIGERVAEAQLTASGYRTSIYKIQGYWNDQGQKIFVSGIESSLQDIPIIARQIDAPKIELTAQDRLWTVNNGNQIIGPIHPKEIAKLLYSQDLDFDCECWEADGNRLSIAKSGMFGVSEDSDARFWIFDGETIHGPLTEGFVRTGVSRRIFKNQAYLCESNTLMGWKQLGAWLESKTVVLEVPANHSQPAQSDRALAEAGLENVSPPTFDFPERSQPEASPEFTLEAASTASAETDDAQIEIVDIDRVDDVA